jgi:hypothetical protein
MISPEFSNAEKRKNCAFYKVRPCLKAGFITVFIYIHSLHLYLYSSLDPEDIKAPVVTALNAFALNVQWSAPGISNGYVTNYIVRVLETGANYSMSSPSVFEYNVTGLRPYIVYR